MADDADVLARLRAGDQKAFVELVDRYHAPMLRLAGGFVPTRAVAEEVVQDTWLGVVRGIEGFEGRSSLKTWLFRILVNRARSVGARERRTTPVEHGDERAVPAERFGADGTWATPPAPWADSVDQRLLDNETAQLIRVCIDRLPEPQRQVVLLRDVEGLPAADVCVVLGVSDGNQRVLLHRGRSRIRRMLEDEMGGS